MHSLEICILVFSWDYFNVFVIFVRNKLFNTVSQDVKNTAKLLKN